MWHHMTSGSMSVDQQPIRKRSVLLDNYGLSEKYEAFPTICVEWAVDHYGLALT